MKEFIPQMQPNFDEKEAKACYDYLMSGGWVTEFKHTKEFERQIANFTGAKYCHAVNNGTISLSIALLAVGIKPGDKVIVPNITMIATPNAAKLIGAIPIFVDVDKETLCLSIMETQELLKNDKEIRAAFHVSLNTRCNNIIKLKKICKENNVFLIEDSAQSLGSCYKGKHLGTYGDIGSFSFSSPKIISTGQGGALITDDAELSDKISKLKNFGRIGGGNDIHTQFGINSKFTDLQAVIGLKQMEKLPWRIKRMREMWDLYYSRLSNHRNIMMFAARDDEWIPWFIDIYVDEPKTLQDYLKNKNIGTRVIYPQITSQLIYKQDKQYPVSEYYSKRGLWLPSSTLLTNKNINEICDNIILFFINS